MAYCPNCGNMLSDTDKFCPNCGKPVASTTAIQSTEREVSYKRIEHEKTYQTEHSEEIICPICGKKSDSIKQFTMFKECLFLMIYFRWQMVTYTCCPDCMRKKILEEGVFTSKIITANFFWLVAILPLALIQLYKCNQKGHSKGVML